MRACDQLKQSPADLEKTITDLRALYRSAKKMSSSDDVNKLLDYLVEDLIDSNGFDRIMILRLDRENYVLEMQACYGFQCFTDCKYKVAFDEVSGLLRKVYNDREPLNVVEFQEAKIDGGESSPTCGILKDNYRSSKGTNRRSRINLCVPDLASSQVYSAKAERYQHYTMMNMGRNDQTVCHLLGDVTSFLILPICDEKSFYGYVLADRSVSGKDITSDQIRLATSMASHAAYSVGRALVQKKMLSKIAAQLTEIQEIKKFYQNIIQNLPSGLIVTDRFKQICEINKAAEVLIGYQADELMGKPLECLFVDQSKENKCFYLDTADEIVSCMGAHAEILMRHKKGGSIPIEACFSVIRDINGAISGLTCIFRDITHRKAMQQNLARIDKLASLGEIAAGMAHEIKNPLAGIGGAMQIMAKNYPVESPYHFVFKEVQEQVKRLDSVVNSLLQFARPGQTHFSDVDVAGVIEKVLFLAMRQLEEKRISITKVYGEESSLVRGDDGQIQQVLLNIVLNAIDAMEEGGALTIQSHMESLSATSLLLRKCANSNGSQKASMVNISISDTGHGIDDESLEAIFNPFHTTKAKGTGLGLSISQRIIEQHGGFITVTSSPGVGSTFTVSLPVCGVSGSVGEAEGHVQKQIGPV